MLMDSSATSRREGEGEREGLLVQKKKETKWVSKSLFSWDPRILASTLTMWNYNHQETPQTQPTKVELYLQLLGLEYEISRFNLDDPVPTQEQAIAGMLSACATSAEVELDKNSLCTKSLIQLLSSYTRRVLLVASKHNATSPKALRQVFIFLRVHLPPEFHEETGTDPGVLISSNQRGEEDMLPRSCPMCMEDYTFSHQEKIATTPCFHVFHEKCIATLCLPRGDHHCPLCYHLIQQDDLIYN